MIEGIREIKGFYKLNLGIKSPYPYQQEVWKKIRELDTPLFIRAPTGAIASSIVVFDEAHMYRDGFTLLSTYIEIAVNFINLGYQIRNILF